MRLFIKSHSTSETELERLQDFLASPKRSRTISIEELDGFFAAQIAGPEVVMPSEYLHEIIGADDQFETFEEANEVLGLLTRHWNRIARALANRKTYAPVLIEDEHGIAHSNRWARGFMRGVGLRPDSWKLLFLDEDHSGCLVPILMLYHEYDEDLALRPPPITPDLRGKIVAQIVDGLPDIYWYFRRRGLAQASGAVSQRGNRAGRNDPCPYGSGKKWKRCCGAQQG